MSPPRQASLFVQGPVEFYLPRPRYCPDSRTGPNMLINQDVRTLCTVRRTGLRRYTEAHAGAKLLINLVQKSFSITGV